MDFLDFKIHRIHIQTTQIAISMIDNNNFKAVLIALGFEETRLLFSKHFPDGDFYLKVNFSNGQIIYPQGLTIHDATTCNLSANENFVVFECVHRLLMKGLQTETHRT
ncbi:MAG: hypothetical protein RIS64_1541 [Bacteroidota bacterium]